MFRLLVFVWWTANGDMHLKNFSLLATPEGLQRLSPAYDLLCTQLVIPDDQLALPVKGRRDRLTRANWLELAAYCGIGPKAAARVLDETAASLSQALELVDRSALPRDDQQAYRGILEARTRTLMP